MKIITWNVNGLRAALSKGIWSWTASQQPDAVCLQEIKAKPEQLTEQQQGIFNDYLSYWHPAERLGYSGVATILQKPCLASKTGIGLDIYDVEGRVIQTRHSSFTLFNIYFPNGQRDLGRLTFKLDFYA